MKDNLLIKLQKTEKGKVLAWLWLYPFCYSPIYILILILGEFGKQMKIMFVDPKILVGV
jgi:hypothetical protein